MDDICKNKKIKSNKFIIQGCDIYEIFKFGNKYWHWVY